MKHQKAHTIIFSFIFAAFLLTASTYAGFPIRVEKDVAYGEINMDNAETLVVTFNIYDSEFASTEVATQDFQPDQWWAEYDFKVFRVPTTSILNLDIVRFQADFTETDGLACDVQYWLEIELDGQVRGNREKIPCEVCALCSEQSSSGPFEVYDSGWFAVSANNTYTRDHNLGTTKVIVSVYSATDSSGTGMQFEGCIFLGGNYYFGINVYNITTTQISIFPQSTGFHIIPNIRNYITSGYARIVMIALE